MDKKELKKELDKRQKTLDTEVKMYNVLKQKINELEVRIISDKSKVDLLKELLGEKKEEKKDKNSKK